MLRHLLRVTIARRLRPAPARPLLNRQESGIHTPSDTKSADHVIRYLLPMGTSNGLEMQERGVYVHQGHAGKTADQGDELVQVRRATPRDDGADQDEEEP